MCARVFMWDGHRQILPMWGRVQPETAVREWEGAGAGQGCGHRHGACPFPDEPADPGRTNLIHQNTQKTSSPRFSPLV